MSDEIDRAITRARADAEPGALPLLVFVTPTPLQLYGEVLQLLGEGLDDLGWTAYFVEATGLAVMWAKPNPKATPDDE